MERIVAVSGGFDPLHIGHIEMMRMAKELGDKLIVIVNTDKFLMDKKGYAFMPLQERMEIIRAIKYVDDVIPCIDEDMTVCKTLEILKPDIFANGGDRGKGNIPEEQVCRENNITMVWGLGDKIQSSSSLVGKVREQ